jgi:hypothetical protein
MAINNPRQHALQPISEGADYGFVRFDSSSTITLSELPRLSLQALEITDRGIVRLGLSNITSAR